LGSAQKPEPVSRPGCLLEIRGSGTIRSHTPSTTARSTRTGHAKSIGAEDTFAADIVDPQASLAELKPLVAKVWGYREGKGFRGRAVTLKIEFVDFRQITRSRTVAVPIELSDFDHLAAELLGSVFPVRKRKTACRVSRFRRWATCCQRISGSYGSNSRYLHGRGKNQP
jgi:nucleotidyltransferase/DNA polymerase involved in DNA repair